MIAYYLAMNKIFNPNYKLYVLFLFLILYNTQLNAVNFPKAENGKINLSDWNFGEDAIIKLTGQWEFFEGKLIKTYPSKTPKNPNFINVPDNWNYQTEGKQIISGQGFGSYRLLISLNTESALSLKVKDIASASKIWVNNKLVYSAGIIDTIPQNNSPQFKPAIFSLPLDTNLYELVVEVSNYNHQMGGLWDNIFIGRKEQISLQHERETIQNFFIYGAIFIIGLYHLGLFLLRKKDQMSLNFGLFCFMISLNSMTRDRILFYFYPEFDWELSYKIEYISLFACLPLFYIFFYLSFKEDFNRFFKTLSIIIVGIFGGITLFTKTIVFSHLLTPYHILLGIYAIVVISSLTKSLYKRRLGANLILVGFIFFFIAMTNDILHARNIINTTVLMNYGVFAFVIVQAFFLAKQSVAAYKQIEELSSNLILINQSLEKFVPNAFLKLLSKENISEVSLGNNIEKQMSIMFSDIRSFTSISEKLKPQEAFEFINEYLKKMGPVIRNHNGFIDKYIGDGIMALFPENPENAVNASIEMMEQLIAFNKENEQKNLPQIDIGVGIHTGMCMLGTVGEYERMDTTVISDAVNLAARIESLTKTYKTPILISEETYNGLSKNKKIKVRYIGIATVKGKSISTKLYEILVRHEYNDEELSSFDEGIHKYYQKDFQGAKESFQKLLGKHSQDGVLQYYLNRIEKYLQEGLAENWNSFEVFDY